VRIWNLSTLNELEASVVGTFQRRSRLRPHVSRSSSLKTTLTVATAALAVSASLALPWPHISTASLSINAAEPAVVAQSVPRIAPPLSDLFEGRFSSSWSAEEERRALERMAVTYKGAAEFDEGELLDVTLANQQESFEAGVPRLTPDRILRIIRKRSM